jgi:hypothetical protein
MLLLAFYVLGCPTRGILSIVSVALVIYVLVSWEKAFACAAELFHIDLQRQP